MYAGIRTVQMKPKSYIKKIGGNWYYLDEVHAFSKPYNTYKEAEDALRQEYTQHETKLKECT